MRTELLADGHVWLRIAQPGWDDPVDPTWSGMAGQRWNAPGSFPCLYLNEDIVTARINARRLFASMPYGPEDLRSDGGPTLVSATLPRRQRVLDVHTPAGVAAVRLPADYPMDARGRTVRHAVCQPIGAAAHAAGLRGVRCRSARTPFGAGRELAWFPATRRSRAQIVSTQAFEDWFWS